MSEYGLTLRGCYLSPRELVRRAIARGDITLATPTRGTKPVNKGVWTAESRAKKSHEQIDRHAKRNERIRAAWTPEKRAEQSARLKRIHRGEPMEGAA